MEKSLLIDQKILTQIDYLTPFALTDQFLSTASQNQQQILHFWQLDQAVILGMKDTRLPYFSDGLAYLKDAGYQPVLRNSGGLGVVSDSGILNISLVLPQPLTGKLAIDTGYEKMAELLQTALKELGKITTGEIKTSYCPGTYDLSIKGQKIAGIAQRRNKYGMAVMLYLSVAKPQADRGQLMKNFYRVSLKEHYDKSDYPKVDPASMTSLAELGLELSLTELKEKLALAYSEVFDTALTTLPLKESGLLQADTYLTRLAAMEKRNEGIL